MAEVLDTFELRHVSTTYSEDKDSNFHGSSFVTYEKLVRHL